eukprot:676815-Amphidinium_carterae.1
MSYLAARTIVVYLCHETLLHTDVPPNCNAFMSESALMRRECGSDANLPGSSTSWLGPKCSHWCSSYVCSTVLELKLADTIA